MRMPRLGSIVALIIVLAAAVSCAKKQQAAPSSPDAGAPAAAPAAQPATVTGSTTAGAWPPGVLHAYYWECDGGFTVVMKNLVRDDAISLELHDGTHKLPHVPSASGAKYADESIEFWTKGGAATYEHKPAPPINCRDARARSLTEDARARGVAWRGRGNEPGWTVEIGPGDALVLQTGYGDVQHAFSGVQASGDAQPGGRVYTAKSADDAIRVTVTREPCTDDMSGQAFDFSFHVETGGKKLQGCGEQLGPG